MLENELFAAKNPVLDKLSVASAITETALVNLWNSTIDKTEPQTMYETAQAFVKRLPKQVPDTLWPSLNRFETIMLGMRTILSVVDLYTVGGMGIEEKEGMFESALAEIINGKRNVDAKIPKPQTIHQAARRGIAEYLSASAGHHISTDFIYQHAEPYKQIMTAVYNFTKGESGLSEGEIAFLIKSYASEFKFKGSTKQLEEFLRTQGGAVSLETQGEASGVGDPTFQAAARSSLTEALFLAISRLPAQLGYAVEGTYFEGMNDRQLGLRVPEVLEGRKITDGGTVASWRAQALRVLRSTPWFDLLSDYQTLGQEDADIPVGYPSPPPSSRQVAIYPPITEGVNQKPEKVTEETKRPVF